MILSRNMVVKKSECYEQRRSVFRRMAGETLYKRDLAMGYAPDITPVAALNRLSAWIHHHKSLYQALLDSGYVDRQRIFNSVQVGLIFHYLGRP